MSQEQDALLGINSDDTTRDYLAKKARTQPSRVRELTQEKGLPEPGAAIGAEKMKDILEQPPVPAPQVTPDPTATPAGEPGVAPAQQPAAQAASQIKSGMKPGDRSMAADIPLQVVGGLRDFGQSMITGVTALDAYLTSVGWGEGGGVSAGSNMAQAAMGNKASSDAAAKRAEKVKEIGTMIKLPEVAQPDTLAGGLTRGMTQFVAGFLPALKAIQGLGFASKIGQGSEALQVAEAMGNTGAFTEALKAFQTAGKVAAGAETTAASMVTNFAAFDAHAERLSNFLKEFPILNNPVTRYLAANPNDSELEGRVKNVIEGLGVDAALSTAFLGGLKTVRAFKKFREAEAVAAKMGAGEAEAGAKGKIKAPKELPAKDILGAQKDLLKPGVNTNLDKTRIAGKLPPINEVLDKVGMDISVSADSTDKAMNINLGRIQTSDDVKNVLKNTADIFKSDIQEATRGVQTNAVTEQLADDLGLTVEDLLKRRKGEAFNAEQATAARKLLVSSAENLRNLAAKVQSLDATDADRFVFRRAVAVHAALQKEVSGLTAEAGRALQAFNIMAKSQKEQMAAIQNILEATGGRGTADDLAQAILDSNSLKGINLVAREAYQASLSDMVFEVWVNGILSGPRTHVTNTISNLIRAMIDLPEKATASLIGKVLNTQGGVHVGEVLAHAHGMMEGIREGWKMAVETFKNEGLTDPLTKGMTADRRAITAENLSRTFLGRNIIDPVLKSLSAKQLAEGGMFGNFVDALGAVVRFPGFRMLNSEDAFFKALNYRAELHAQAFREAIQEGHSGMELAQRIADLLEQPSETMRIAATNMAHEATFTNPNKVARNLAQFTRSVPGLRYIIPFINTPTNIVKTGLERTPFALMSGQVRADIFAGGARRDMALGRIALGSSLLALGWMQAKAGKITGGAPQDPGLRKVWMQENQEYSIVFQDGDKKTFVSYNRFEPFGMLLGAAADYANIVGQIGEKDASELVAASVMAMMKNITSKTWLKGISDFLVALDEPERRLNNFALNMATGFVPNLINQVNGAMVDPVLRETRGFRGGNFAAKSLASYIDAVKEKIPGYSKTLPPMRTLWGEPIEPREGFNDENGQKVYNLLSPAYVKEIKGDKVNQTILDNEIDLDMPRRSFDIPGVPTAIELTPAEYSRYVELAGKPAKAALDQIVKNPGFENAPKFQKDQIFRQVVNEFRQRAKAQLISEDKELKNRIDEARQDFQDELSKKQAAGQR